LVRFSISIYNIILFEWHYCLIQREREVLFLLETASRSLVTFGTIGLHRLLALMQFLQICCYMSRILKLFYIATLSKYSLNYATLEF
jgi:hypothetical protein